MEEKGPVDNLIAGKFGNGLTPPTVPNFDPIAATANLAVTIVDVQKELATLKTAVQQLSNHLGILMQAHNNLADKVYDKAPDEKQEAIPTGDTKN